MKKILIFAPYGNWIVHHQLDAILGAALALRKCNVAVICCDGLFEKCHLARNISDSSIRCKDCLKKAYSLFTAFKLKVIKLSSLLSSSDFKLCKQWSYNLKKEDYSNAVFEGLNLGKISRVGVCSYFITGTIDLKNKEVADVYRGFLYSCSLITRALTNINHHFLPDHVICFQGKIPYYATVLSFYKKLNINVLLHERGMIDDTFSFRINGHGGVSAGRAEAFENWRSVPLTQKQCIEVQSLLSERENGKNINRSPFYTLKDSNEEKDIRKKLRIPEGNSIISIFTSSDWELAMNDNIENSTKFQENTIQELFSKITDSNYYFVVRHHPNIIGNDYMASSFLERLFLLNRERPHNVRIIMPKEKITSYDLIWQSDAAVTFGSTIGVESILRGLPVVGMIDNIYNLLDIGIIKCNTLSKYIIEAAVKKNSNYCIDDLRIAYRGFHYYFYKLSQRFKSFGFKNINNYDIRVSKLSELLEGNDPALDNICNYIIYNTPLFSPPTEIEKQQSDYEETNLLQKELFDIQQQRKNIRSKFSKHRYVNVPQLSVLRFRTDGIHLINEPESILITTAKNSRYQHIEINEIATPHYFDILYFLHEFEIAIKIAKGEYIYFGTDDIHIDESFFSSSIDFLQKSDNKTYDGVITGAWICSNEGVIINKIFIEQLDTDNYEQSKKIFPNMSNPLYLLSFLIWRKTSLLKMISLFDSKITSFQQLSKFLFFHTMSNNSSFNFYKTLIPNITIYTPLSQKEVVSEIERLLKTQEYEKLSHLLEMAKIKGFEIEDIDYYRALSYYYTRKFVAASLSVKTQLQKVPSDEKTLNLLSKIFLDNNINSFYYNDIQEQIESVKGWLVPGQEKFLFDKVKSLPENSNILEIGPNHGRSTVSMAFACVNTNKTLITIDTFIGMTCGGTKLRGNTFFDVFYSNIVKLDLGRYVKPIIGLSSDNLKKLKDKYKFDFVFIDASHHYTHLIKDFELVYPLVKDGGWIAFHDVAPDWPGPWRVWVETAMPLLSSHEYCSTIACGQKMPGRKFILPENTSFNYAREWAKAIKSFAPETSNAMDTLITAEGNIIDPKFDYADVKIASMHEKLIFSLREMLKLEASEDPFLHYFNALTYLNEKKYQKALDSLNQSNESSKLNAFLQKRIRLHLERINSFVTVLLKKKM